MNLTLAVLLVLTGFGSWWLWGRHLPLTDLPHSRIAGEQGRSPENALAIADLEGAGENYAAIDTLAGLRALNTLTDAELAVYQAAGTSRVRVAVSNYELGKATITLARTRSADKASRAARKLNQLQLGYGFQRAKSDLAGASVLPPAEGGQPGGRAHYAHERILVRVAFRGPNASAAYQKFTTLLRRQLEVLPAHG